MASSRTFLGLGRIAVLPTVCSDCLAGWWLGGGGHLERLPALFIGACLVYLGGGFLDHAFEAECDRDDQSGQPAPSGEISSKTAWRWGLAWLIAGGLSLFWLGEATGGLGLALTACVILYHALHKLLAFGPVLLGLCRFLVYVTASASAANGVTGWAIWCGLALAGYVAGARHAVNSLGSREPLRHWPLALLAAPVVLALVMNADTYRTPALLLSAVLGLWVVRALRPTWWPGGPNPRLSRAPWHSERAAVPLGGKQEQAVELPAEPAGAFTASEVHQTASGLLAGIVFADWLAVADAPRELSFYFLALFGVTLLLQRIGAVHRQKSRAI